MNEKNLIPVLVGMDHLGSQGCQMLIDFGTGLGMDGVDEKPEIYQLHCKNKGHFVYDIVFQLTRDTATMTVMQ